MAMYILCSCTLDISSTPRQSRQNVNAKTQLMFAKPSKAQAVNFNRDDEALANHPEGNPADR